jgi:3-hydroxybutyryl-CoA dehydrogenase
MAIERVAVIGAGLMGTNIALDFALHGVAVRLTDTSADALDRSFKTAVANAGTVAAHGLTTESPDTVCARIETTTSLTEAVAEADLVIESVSEDLALKQRLFPEIARHAPAHAILASNTSSFMPTTLGAATDCPERVMVAHYYNPAHLLPLVELVAGQKTDPAHVDTLFALYTEMGKTPVRLRREAMGFIGNRLQFALIREALAIIESGIGTPEDVDTVLRASLARRMPVTGIFRSMDLGGLDTMLAICRVLFPDLAIATEPGPRLAELVEAGRLGAKAESGWYEYAPGAADQVRRELAEALIRVKQRDSSALPEG